MVKSNTIWLIRQLRADDSFSIIVFSDQAELLGSLIHKQDLQWIEARISQIQAGGSTEIFNGLRCGLTELQNSFKSNATNHLVLLTDGQTYGDEEDCFTLAKEAASQGIGISSLGYGHHWNDAFLDKLVSLSGGSSLYVSSPNRTP